MNITAISTPPGVGGIAVIRVSGPQAIEITGKIFRPKNPAHTLSCRPAYSMTFGQIIQENGEPLDEVIVSLYRAPHSFTGEVITEISCHGSVYIQQTLLQLLLRNGCRMAGPGEFTRRAFANGRLDLSQAEAVADLIAADSAAAHRLAMNQMKGAFSKRLKELRKQLLSLSSLLELELDFSEEDVEFANRSQLMNLADEIQGDVTHLAESFQTGNAIRNGIPVAIIGETNAGKSTLLNALLGDDKAIVSDIHGTTRDVIEDTCIMNGILLRFIDTAGIRDTRDRIETMGIERTYQKLDQASIVLWMIDGTRLGDRHLTESLILDATDLYRRISPYLHTRQKIYVIINKSDLVAPGTLQKNLPLLQDALNNFSIKTEELPQNERLRYLTISAKTGAGISDLKEKLHSAAQQPDIQSGDVIVTNIRHYEALTHAAAAISRVKQGLITQLPGDLIAQDLRECNYYLGSIIGEISNNELLGSIFSKFCVGK